jgi:hypothetical protein
LIFSSNSWHQSKAFESLFIEDETSDIIVNADVNAVKKFNIEDNIICFAVII